VGIVVAVVVIVAVVIPRTRASGPTTLTVMTRNVYLGADVNRVVDAVSGLQGEEALVVLGAATRELHEIVARTDFGIRSRLLAAEIAAARPDLVGLQEVALWRQGPLQLENPGRADATEVDEDYLETLQSELLRRGLTYDVVQVQETTDVEAPSFAGDPAKESIEDARDIRLTLRDVILIRSDAEIRVRDQGSGRYDARLNIDLGGVAYAYVRGYAWADLERNGTRFRFATTHLESELADLTLAQAEELVTGPASDTDRPVILACDCNSDPATTTLRPGDGVPRNAAYQRLTGAGYADQWSSLGPEAGSGFTALLSETVDDPNAAGLNRRVDLVLARGTEQVPVTAVRGALTGHQPSVRDPGTNLWPSDHAGVIIELRLGQ
jgi:endonuclease/exonuclease/phosphatase family metal-dependent hydrolase